MRRISALAIVAVAAVSLCACIAPRPKAGDKPSPLTIAPASSGGEALPRFGAIAMNDRTGSAVTARTSVVSSEHISQSTPTDSGGELATVTGNRLDVNAVVTDGSGALNVIVDSGAVTATISGGATEVTLADIEGDIDTVVARTPALGQAAMAASSPVVIANNQSAVPISGTVTATDGSGAMNTIVDSSALPTGASTSALQTTGNTSVGNIDTKTPALGQAAMAASTPVVIASNQSAVPVSGTVTVGALASTAKNGYFEATPFNAINSSSDSFTGAIDLRGYADVWFEAEFSVTAAGTLEVLGALSSAGTGTYPAERGIPLYDVIETGSACSHADGDRTIAVTYTSGGGDAVCKWRVPAPPPYLVIGWDRSSGGGASGLTIRAYGRAL
jgi:hypothetical protein